MSDLDNKGNNTAANWPTMTRSARRDERLDSTTLTGLTGEEAIRRLAMNGPNVVADTGLHIFQMVLEKFWAPIPWMLEVAILLELGLGKPIEATIVAALLLFNAVLGIVHESRAQATLAALRDRLAINASVRRDNVWRTVAAAELVPGDVVKLSLGTVVPADVRLVAGGVLLDQSMLTGESVPIEAGAGFPTYAGALVRRGEAVAEVTATGARTAFGRTAELVQTAHAVSSQQQAVLHVVRNLAWLNGLVILFLVGYSLVLRLPLTDVVSLCLTALLAAIPVALPATFTLAAAVGARELVRKGVLPTRLSAVDEAASMDVLCSDKTGTLTQNALQVTEVRPMPGFTPAYVLALAALASAEGTQDPVDGAIHAAANVAPVSGLGQRLVFVPFDPTTKMSSATVARTDGAKRRIVKGAFACVARLAQPRSGAAEIAESLAGQGYRVLAVAAGPLEALELVGLIALSDPPRTDSAGLISELRGLGVRTVMVTGDAPTTAAIIARKVGMIGPTYPSGPVSGQIHANQYAVFAGVLPEEKFKLVEAFQSGGHIVGMCGDGANDAPALRQAQMGIAVSTATDVAKSAAGMVLTTEGLGGIVSAVTVGRTAFQRILSYTLHTITKKTVQALFLAAGLIMIGQAILTPYLMVLVMITGDFLGMSLTTDKVRPSPRPNVWRIGNITIAGVFVGLVELIFCITFLGVGFYWLRLGLGKLRTLAFLLIVFGNQATCYTDRDRRHWWSSRPSIWLMLSSILDLMIASTLAIKGIGMVPLAPLAVGSVLAGAMVLLVVMDFVKAPLFMRLRLA